jgi:hypothetical protein
MRDADDGFDRQWTHSLHDMRKRQCVEPCFHTTEQ